MSNKIIQRSLLQLSMHCNYCQSTNLRESRHYNIENVRERFNPTYFHSQIFGSTQPVVSKVRCTPTFHSQAFKIDGYGHNCKGKCVKKSEAAHKNTVQARKSNKNGDFMNSRGKSCYNGRVKWYDQQKNEKFNHIQSNYDYSRERKYADLASSSVFDGYVYHSHCAQNELCSCDDCQCLNCQCGKTKIAELQAQKCSTGCKCQVCNCVNCQCGKKNEIKSIICVNCQCADCKCSKQTQNNNCKCINCQCVNCQCGKTNQSQCMCFNYPQNKQVAQVPKQNCICTNCQCVNCQCGKKVEVNACKCINCKCVECICGKPTEVRTCKCSNCQCVNCNCESGCCQKNAQKKPVVVAKEQVTFGKNGTNKVQKRFSQPKKVIKQKPTFTVIRQKK